MTITLHCPECNRLVRSAPLMRFATLALRRTCSGCRLIWAVRVRPVAFKTGFAAHEVTWTQISPRREGGGI
jgi:hypothetical protein